MLCNKCGFEINDSSKFCKNCGSPIGKGNNANLKQNSSKNLLRKKLFLIIGIVVLLLISAILAYFLFVNKPDEPLISEETATQMTIDSLMSQFCINEATKDYYDEEGFIKNGMESKAINACKSALQEKMGERIKEIKTNSSSLSIRLRDGELMVYEPPHNGVANGVGNLNIEVYEPYHDANKKFSEAGDTYSRYNKGQDDASSESSNNKKLEYNNCVYRNSNVSVEELKKCFGQNELILWEGHGGIAYDGNNWTPIISTGTSIVEDNRELEWEYLRSEIGNLFSDESYQMSMIDSIVKQYHKYGSCLQDGTLAVMYSGGSRFLYQSAFFGFTPEFISHYYGLSALQDSVFYLGACHSLETDMMANALLGRSAGAVYGFTQEVSFRYINELRPKLLECLNNGDSYMCASGGALKKWSESDILYDLRDKNGNKISNNIWQSEYPYGNLRYFDYYNYYMNYPEMVKKDEVESSIAKLKCRSSENDYHSFETQDFYLDVKGEYEKRWLVYFEYNGDYDCPSYIFYFDPQLRFGNNVGTIDTIFISDKPLSNIKNGELYYLGATTSNKYIYIKHSQSTFIEVNFSNWGHQSDSEKFYGVEREYLSTEIKNSAILTIK